MVKSETCLYTLTSTQNFLIDFHPQNKAIVIATGGSGHAFKFGPLIGSAVANLLIEGTSGISEFEVMRPLFSL